MLFVHECIHCFSPAKKIFCAHCSKDIALLEKKGFEEGLLLKRALFSRYSPLYSLYKEMEKGKLLCYVKAFAAYIFYAIEKDFFQLIFCRYPGFFSYLFRNGILYEISLEMARYARFSVRFFSEKAASSLEGAVQGSVLYIEKVASMLTQKEKALLQEKKIFLLTLFDEEE